MDFKQLYFIILLYRRIAAIITFFLSFKSVLGRSYVKNELFQIENGYTCVLCIEPIVYTLKY